MSDTRALLSRGARPDGRILTSSEREQLAQPYLRQPSRQQPSRQSQTRLQPERLGHRATLSLYLHTFLHRLTFQLIQLIFSIYILLRQTYHSLHDRLISILYHHHRTPELIRRDIRNLSRLPQHLSIVLSLDSYASSSASTPPLPTSESLSALLADAASISAWCACAGIPTLSLYERTGLLKAHIPALHRAVNATFYTYFPASGIPSLHIRAPNHPAYSPPSSPDALRPASPLSSDSAGTSPLQAANLNLLLLSATDGRDTLIDLTKTLAEMSQKGKLRPNDISAELIDAELTAASCGEPDLLIMMAAPAWKGAPVRGPVVKRRGSAVGGGGSGVAMVSGLVEEGGEGDDDEGYAGGGGAGGDVCLMGYPPWQVRLTEIFHVQDNTGVDYQVFLRGLHKYAKAEMRFGR